MSEQPDNNILTVGGSRPSAYKLLSIRAQTNIVRVNIVYIHLQAKLGKFFNTK